MSKLTRNQSSRFCSGEPAALVLPSHGRDARTCLRADDSLTAARPRTQLPGPVHVTPSLPRVGWSSLLKSTVRSLPIVARATSSWSRAGPEPASPGYGLPRRESPDDKVEHGPSCSRVHEGRLAATTSPASARCPTRYRTSSGPVPPVASRRRDRGVPCERHRRCIDHRMH